jgi:hypothetical protein
MSPSCGFAPESTIPEMWRLRVASRRGMNFRQPAVQIALVIANRQGSCGAPIDGCDQRPRWWV